MLKYRFTKANTTVSKPTRLSVGEGLAPPARRKRRFPLRPGECVKPTWCRRAVGLGALRVDARPYGADGRFTSVRTFPKWRGCGRMISAPTEMGKPAMLYDAETFPTVVGADALIGPQPAIRYNRPTVRRRPHLTVGAAISRPLKKKKAVTPEGFKKQNRSPAKRVRF